MGLIDADPFLVAAVNAFGQVVAIVPGQWSAALGIYETTLGDRKRPHLVRALQNLRHDRRV